MTYRLPLRVEKTDGSPANPELSNEGMDQVKRLARWMKDEKLDAIYCSPLMRARMTAQPLADYRHMQLIIEPGVAEIDEHSTTYIPLE